MTALAGAVVGFAVGALLLRLLGGVLASPALARENHRGATLATAGGLVLVATALAVEAGWSLLDAVRDVPALPGRRAALLVVLGFGFLGLLDDVVGSGGDGRGFRGHLGALRHGRLTTGGLKLLGGAAVAVVAAAQLERRLGWLVLDALVVALAANVGNLLDRAPGRTTKVAMVAVVALLAVSRADHRLTGVAVAAGACLALLGADLGERLMLGDTGANAVGAVLAFGAVSVAGGPARVVLFGVLLALNVAAELVSFSSVIDRTPPLRWLDRLGRRV